MRKADNLLYLYLITYIYTYTNLKKNLEIKKYFVIHNERLVILVSVLKDILIRKYKILEIYE